MPTDMTPTPNKLTEHDVHVAIIGGISGMLAAVIVLALASRLGISRAANEINGGLSEFLRGFGGMR